MPKPSLLPRQEKKGLVGLKTDKPYTNCHELCWQARLQRQVSKWWQNPLLVCVCDALQKIRIVYYFQLFNSNAKEQGWFHKADLKLRKYLFLHFYTLLKQSY